MFAHARPHSAHVSRAARASRTQPLTSRPITVVTLGLTVSVLAVSTLVHAPARADAAEMLVPTTSTLTSGSTLSPLTPTDVTDTRLARLVAIRQERLQQQAEIAARELRQERRERRERREARQERRERRQQARAAARAAARAPQWVMPVSGAGWSASFGEAGSSWSSGYHTGQDFTAPSGTPVFAVSDGTITSANWSDAYGNIIEITHANGDQSWYAHMSGFERTSGGVGAGDVIGYVGCTGNCFGDHLHFEYHPGGGEAADPIAWLDRNGL
jgi:murein DD-endopeptidase MepM/ murein hydrolase activator NlpD